MSEFPFAILLMGPTASGKTDLALHIQDRFPVEIISVDSALVYRGMDIGTSKPDAAILAQVKHHLIDILEPDRAYSAASFRQDALDIMRDIVARGKIPLLVGGTMLYFRALTEGLSVLPAADTRIREQLTKTLHTHGSTYLHERLQHIDPAAANRIHPNDPQRILRALEVYEITGKSLSDWWQEKSRQSFPYKPLRLILSTADRGVLHQRIESRFVRMLKHGFIEEVMALRGRGDLDLNNPSMRSVGYRQVWQYLDGSLLYDDLVEKGIAATRQLAKRQLTWLRREPDANWIFSDQGDANDTATNIIGNIFA